MGAKGPRLTELKKQQLSRTKVELFCECPRCFWLNVRKGVRRVSGPSFSLNIAVDALVKREMEIYREAGTIPPAMQRAGLTLVPYKDARMPDWTHNFTGVRWTDPETGWTLYGAIDDLWLDIVAKMLHPADCKATAKAEDPTTETLYPHYGRQQEIYTFLLRQQNLPFPVSDRHYFYYLNGDKKRADFGEALHFKTLIVPRDGNDGWVLETFRAAVACATSDAVPAAGGECEWCAYRAQAAAMVLGPLPQVAQSEPELARAA